MILRTVFSVLIVMLVGSAPVLAYWLETREPAVAKFREPEWFNWADVRRIHALYMADELTPFELEQKLHSVIVEGRRLAPELRRTRAEKAGITELRRQLEMYRQGYNADEIRRRTKGDGHGAQ